MIYQERTLIQASFQYSDGMFDTFLLDILHEQVVAQGQASLDKMSRGGVNVFQALFLK